MEVYLDIMKEDDLGCVLKIEKECFSNPWNVKFFREELRHNTFAMYLTAKVDKIIVGYVGYWFKNHVKEIHIVNLAVKSSYRRKGIGTYLIEEIIAMAQNLKADYVTLEVRFTNKKAIKLYKELGFYEAGLTPDYYLDNKEDALLMKKELNKDD